MTILSECSIPWSDKIGMIWVKRPETDANKWLKLHHARYVINEDEVEDAIVFETPEDAVAFKLKYGV